MPVYHCQKIVASHQKCEDRWSLTVQYVVQLAVPYVQSEMQLSMYYSPYSRRINSSGVRFGTWCTSSSSR
jgi:hypothetical protein